MRLRRVRELIGLYHFRPHSIVIAAGAIVLLAAGATGARAAEVPAGTRVEVRLEQTISTYSSPKGSAVAAVLAAPLRRQGQTILPLGTRITGHLVGVRRVGVGLIRETAALEMRFDHLELPDHTPVEIDARVVEVQNSREKVDDTGRIRGVRSTSTMAYKTAGAANVLALSNPIGLMFTTGASASLLRFSDPEISLPAGTELVLQMEKAVEFTAPAAAPEVPAMAASDGDRARLRELVARLPYRTATARSDKPSDATNLVFVGSREELEAALHTAGWVAADPLTAQTAYRAFRSIMESQGYQSAPMSMLTLDGKQPDYVYSKTLDTFSKRHHLRVWLLSETWNGEPVWTSSSTQDIGIGFSRERRTFLHLIDTHIDNERAKVVNDMVLSGCTDGLNLVTRPWLPPDMSNATGEKLITDGNIAVVHLTACRRPLTPAAVDQRLRGNMAERVTRQSVLTLKNNLIRENIFGMTYGGIRYLRNRGKSAGLALTERQIVVDGDTYVVENAADTKVLWIPGQLNVKTDLTVGAAEAAATERQKLAPALVEIGLHAGYTRYASSTMSLVSFDFMPSATQNMTVSSGNRLDNGWELGLTVTLNSHRYLSHELNFDYERTSFRLVQLAGTMANSANFEPRDTGLATAQFGYSLLVNLRPRTSRVRPYVAAGPELQLSHLTNAPLKKAPVYFKFALQNIGIISAAYDFGSTPPLQGGGIFQPGAQYGGGVRVRISRRWLWRTDFRETLTSQPDFWAKAAGAIQKSLNQDPSFTGWKVTQIGPSLGGVLRRQRFTSGVSFVF